MADNPDKRGKPDRIRVNVGQAHERVYWSSRFGVTQKLLMAIVQDVGPMVKNVKRWLIERIRKA